MKSFTIKLVGTWLCIAAVLADQGDTGARSLPYCDLAKAPDSYAGKRIRVRAIYRYGFEIQRLDPPSCCSEPRPKIWVEMGSSLQAPSRRLLHKLPRGMGLALATFEGTFEKGGPYGDGGYRFKLNVDKIDKLEATAKASNHGIPWIPTNCEVAN